MTNKVRATLSGNPLSSLRDQAPTGLAGSRINQAREALVVVPILILIIAAAALFGGA